MHGSRQEAPTIVIGSGLGGLVTALAVGRQGRRVQRLEQSAEILPIGYGVQIDPNVLPILESLGAGQDVRQATCRPEGLLRLYCPGCLWNNKENK